MDTQILLTKRQTLRELDHQTSSQVTLDSERVRHPRDPDSAETTCDTRNSIEAGIAVNGYGSCKNTPPR